MSKTCLNPQPEPARGSQSGGGAEGARGGTWQSGSSDRVGSFLQFKETAKRRAHTPMVAEESGSCDVSRVNSSAAGVFSLS